MSALAIRVLGPLELVVDGVPAIVKASQQRVVLECLALRANTVVSADSLVEIVWGEHPPAKPVPQLQVYIAHLRQQLDPGRSKGSAAERIASRPGGYLLTATGDELDVLQFTELLEVGEQAVAKGKLDEGSEYLQSAIALFRGPGFPDLIDIETLQPELSKLEARRLDAQQNYFDVELALGRHTSIIPELEAVLAREPYRERLWEAYVLGLYRAGRQAEALGACRHARRILLNDLGIDPGPRLSSLEELVLKQDRSIAAPPHSVGRRARERLDNLPAAPTPLVGRDRELETLAGIFGATGSRLVTVIGPGGTGKTRIALEAALIQGKRMQDGVCWIELAPLNEPSQVPTAVASALGIGDVAGNDPMRASKRFLRQRRLLIVMDNFEHLEDAWKTTQELLTASPGLLVLATSRRPLGLRAEYIFELEPLSLPRLDPPPPANVVRHNPAIMLFLARGRAARGELKIDDSNARVLARICHRLDGLPLAIELAAAQLRNRTEKELLTELEASIVDLPPAFRDLPERQRTLAATIAWSHRLLPESEAQLFDRLGVFAAEPTIAAVRGVIDPSAAVEERLAVLARHSLLRLRDVPGETTRVSMLQAIREDARERLIQHGDGPVRRSHALYYLGVAEQLGPRLWGSDQVNAFRQLHEDALELRAALLWAAGPDGSREVALRLVGQLWHYWELSEAVKEPCQIAQAVLSQSVDVPHALLGPALSGTATMLWILGQNAEAADYHRRSLESFKQAGNGQGVGWAMLCLSVQAAESGDTEAARALAADVMKYPEAAPRSRLAAEMVREVLTFYDGDVATALEMSRECVQAARALGDRWMRCIALVNHADCLEQTSDADAAEKVLYEAITVGIELGAQGHIAGFLESLAGVYVRQGRSEQGIRLLAATDAYRNDRGNPLNSSERERIERFRSQAYADAGPIRYGLAWSEGQSLTLSQAVEQIVVPAMPVLANVEAGAASAFDVAPNTVNASPWA